MIRRVSVVFTLVYGMAAIAWGVDIPIANAGFEQVVLPCAPGPNCFAREIAAWTATGQIATYKPAAGAHPGGVPEGVNVGSIGNEFGSGVSSKRFCLRS